MQRSKFCAGALQWGAAFHSCPGQEPRALGRHKQSAELFVSGLSPPGRFTDVSLRKMFSRPSSFASLHTAPNRSAPGNVVAVDVLRGPRWFYAEAVG
jgi:hypothetical protein